MNPMSSFPDIYSGQNDLADLLRETTSLKSVAKASNVSVTTVCRMLDCIHYSCPPLKEAVSIDEFKGNACTGNYQCILVNPKNHSIMDILPDRTQSHLTAYFREIDRSQRLRVKYFVCAMWQPYVDLAHTFFRMQKYVLINIILSGRSPGPWKMSASACRKP